MPKIVKTKPTQADRIGKKSVLAWLDEADHRRLKVMAAARGETIQTLVVGAVMRLLSEGEPKPRR